MRESLDKNTVGDEWHLDCPYGCEGGLDQQHQNGPLVDGDTFDVECPDCSGTAILEISVSTTIVASRVKDSDD